MRTSTPHQTTRPITVIGGALTSIGLFGGLYWRIATGRLFWTNVWHQPTSVFLAVPALLIVAVIGLLSVFVWRRQSRSDSGSPHSGKHKTPRS
jgi:hypothetical protein